MSDMVRQQQYHTRPKEQVKSSQAKSGIRHTTHNSGGKQQTQLTPSQMLDAFAALLRHIGVAYSPSGGHDLLFGVSLISLICLLPTFMVPEQRRSVIGVLCWPVGLLLCLCF